MTSLDPGRHCNFTFRIESPIHSIEEISSRLGLEASKCFRVGELKGDRKTVRDANLWILNSALPDIADLPEHVDAMLALIEPVAVALDDMWDQGAEGDLKAIVASDSGQFSTALSADQVARIARLRVDLLLSLYPPQD